MGDAKEGDKEGVKEEEGLHHLEIACEKVEDWVQSLKTSVQSLLDAKTQTEKQEKEASGGEGTAAAAAAAASAAGGGGCGGGDGTLDAAQVRLLKSEVKDVQNLLEAEKREVARLTEEIMSMDVERKMFEKQLSEAEDGHAQEKIKRSMFQEQADALETQVESLRVDKLHEVTDLSRQLKQAEAALLAAQDQLQSLHETHRLLQGQHAEQATATTGASEASAGAADAATSCTAEADGMGGIEDSHDD